MAYTWSLIFDGSINLKKIRFNSFSFFKLALGFLLKTWLNLKHRYWSLIFDGSINLKKIRFNSFSFFKLTFLLNDWLDFFRQDLNLKLSAEAGYWNSESPTSLLVQVSNFRFVLIYTWCLSFDGSINPEKVSFNNFSLFKLNFLLNNWLDSLRQDLNLKVSPEASF